MTKLQKNRNEMVSGIQLALQNLFYGRHRDNCCYHNIDWTAVRQAVPVRVIEFALPINGPSWPSKTDNLEELLTLECSLRIYSPLKIDSKAFGVLHLLQMELFRQRVGDKSSQGTVARSV